MFYRLGRIFSDSKMLFGSDFNRCDQKQERAMTNQTYLPHNNTSQSQMEARQHLLRLFEAQPFNDATLLTNFGLFTRS